MLEANSLAIKTISTNTYFTTPESVNQLPDSDDESVPRQPDK